MPKMLEKTLKKLAREKFGSTKSKAARAYIYTTLRSVGWRPKRENR